MIPSCPTPMLQGVPLHTGRRVAVCWPDGTTTEHLAIVRATRSGGVEAVIRCPLYDGQGDTTDFRLDRLDARVIG